jgi:hypothetical protein
MLKKPNRNDVHAAAAVLIKAKGIPTLMKVLGTYGSVRTGQIQVRDWSQFIADCQKAEAA